MAKKQKIIGRDLNNANLINFGTIQGSILSSIGNFATTTDLSPKVSKDHSGQLGNFSSPITLETLKIDTVSQAKSLLSNNIEVFLNIDKTNLSNYAYFGSLREYIRTSLENIILKWPGSIYLNNIVNTETKNTVLNYSFNELLDESNFTVPVSLIKNKFEIIFDESAKPLESFDSLSNLTYFKSKKNFKNITKYFKRYVVLNDNKEFEIIAFSGSDRSNIYLKTKGNPFPKITGSTTTLSTTYHIKPKYQHVEEFFNSLGNFESYVLNREIKPKYTAEFNEPIETESGRVVLFDKQFTWPLSDGYNLDIDTDQYKDYLESLLLLADKQDAYKTNLVARFFTTTALKEFDTTDGKIDKLLKIYGREFDEVKTFIDGLAYANRISYDKKENIPDQLIKNLARTLGWGVLRGVSEEDLLKSFLGVTSTRTAFSGHSKNITPFEMDVELWRRIILNTNWLFKSKGTRKVLEFLLRFIGAPDCLIDINEHVYLVSGKIDPNNTSLSGLTDFFDESGFPSIPENTTDYYFQQFGRWREQIEVLGKKDNSVGIHLGPYDGGQSYFEPYILAGFQLNKVPDDKKSWVYSDKENEHRFYNRSLTRQADYSGRSELILNTKELDMTLDVAKTIECDVYNYNKLSFDYPVYPTGRTYPYPNDKYTSFNPASLSFAQYIQKIYSHFIDVRNRKVITDNKGGGYPTLRKLYFDYYYRSADTNGGNLQSKAFDKTKILKYIDLLENYWFELIDQLIPSTVIWENGERYRNTIFNRQKFVYRHGINDSSEFQVTQPSTIEGSICTFCIEGKNISVKKGSTGTIIDISGFWQSNFAKKYIN